MTYAGKEGEVSALRKSAALVVLWLVVSLLISLIGAVLFLTKATVVGITDLATQRILLCVMSGTLGSSISALISAAERVSHGWELAGGEKLPTPEPKDKFVARMVPIFVVRPFLGGAMGLLLYAGLTGGYLIAVENAGNVTFSRQGLLFFSFLAGLFSKTFIEKLRAMFDTMFGK